MPQPRLGDRVLGLDVGERRIGLAFASAVSVGSSMVVPAGFLLVDGMEKAVKDLCELVEEDGVTAVVVGMPYVQRPDHSSDDKVLGFRNYLREALPDKIEMYGWDESYSSSSAQSLLVDAELKHSGKSKRGRVDAVALADLYGRSWTRTGTWVWRPGALLI